jgi:AhpD family alkylhydroperoxidase
MVELVPLVPVEDLPSDLRAQYDATARPGLQDFIRLMAHAPDHFRRYNDTYAALRFDNHLGARLTELVRLATAQTTRCPVCMAGRHPDAVEAGLTEELVAEIGSEQPTSMTPAEAVAVGFALKFCTDHLAIDAADQAALREHFTSEQIVELALLCVMCLVGRFSLLAGLEEPACPT